MSEAEPAARRRRTGWAEWNWVLAWSLALAVLTSLPYVYGAARTRLGERYFGFVFNPDEPNVHLSWIRQASEGAWFFRNEFTSEPHTGRFFNLFMLTCGRLAGLLDWPAYRVWAVARFVAVVLFGLIVYAALSTLELNRTRRRHALAVVCLSSGLGWLAVGAGWRLDTVDLEPDLVMPEAISFLHLYLNPLFTVSVALLVLAMIAGERALRRSDARAAVVAGAAALLLANVHTYDAVPLVLVLTGYLGLLCWRDRGWSWARGRCYLLVLGLMLPAVGYQLYLIRSDELYAAKANTPTLTPALRAMLVSYGLLLPLAAYGAWERIRRGQRVAGFWALWAGVQLGCLYLPSGLFPFQRKMAEGLHVPLAALAAVGMVELGRRLGGLLAAGLGPRRARDAGSLMPLLADMAGRRARTCGWVMVVGLVLTVPSNVLFVISTIDALDTNNAAKQHVWMPPFRLPDDDVRAMDWLRENAARDGAVLCLPPIGAYLPGQTGQTVYLGHWAETIWFRHKLSETARFFAAEGTADEKTAFLVRNRIRFVLYGSYERTATGGLLPQLPALTEVYPSPGGGTTGAVARIYQVAAPP